MKLRSTLVLLLVLILLCAGYWAMIRFERTAARSADEARKVFSFVREDIRTLSIKRLEEGPTVGVRSQDGVWAIAAPYPHIRPNPIVWDRVANNLAELRSTRTVEEKPSDLEKYVLDQPELVVQATTADEKQVELHVGIVDPTQRFRYAQADNGPILLITVNAFWELDKGLADLRDSKIIDVGEEGITRIEYARLRADESGSKEYEESTPVVVTKSADGLWRMSLPVEALADQDRIAQIVKFLQFERGRDYVNNPETLADYGLDPPRFRITVNAGTEARSQPVYVGRLAPAKQKPGVYAKFPSEPAVFVLAADITELIPGSPDSWRETRLATRPQTELTSIHYVSQTDDFTLERDDELGWRLANPNEEADQVSVSSFITSLKEAKAESFPENAGPESGLDTPAVSIGLLYRGEEKPGVIRIGAQAPEGGYRYATQDTGVVAKVAETTLAPLCNRTRLQFRSNELMRFAKEDAIRVALTFEGVEYLFEKPQTRWRLRQPEDRILESQSDVDTLLGALNPTLARALVLPQAPENLSQYGLDKPILTVMVTTQKAGQAKEVSLGPLRVGAISQEDPHERYATMEGKPEVYRVSQDIIADIREALRGVKPKN